MDPQQGNTTTGQFDQIVERLRSANNVLVTVTSNPSVDQLAACIGMTLVLNKMGKHASAVFSGRVPSTIEFLQPEKTLEKNTDSLRDFIIALDKSKADKLRYKVEDQVVKIFITPYKTSISEEDLEFSQGDFNIDAVVALGVHDRTQLDQAILAHGRILHDATVMSVNITGGGHLGAIDWVEERSSSLCEMVSDIAHKLSPTIFDTQISTALLTGIVAETDRFSNQKATPHAMSIAGILMAGGASAQLVTTKLEEGRHKKSAKAHEGSTDEPAGADGTLSIDHSVEAAAEEPADKPAKNRQEEKQPPDVTGAVFEEPVPDKHEEEDDEDGETPSSGRVMREPPTLGGQLTANSVPEYKQYSDTTDPLSHADEKDEPILRKRKDQQPEKPQAPSDDKKTLTDIEKEVNSPHLHQNDTVDTAAAREAVEQANPPEYDQKDEAVGAQPLDQGLHEDDDKPSSSPPPPVPPPMMPPA